MKCSGAAIDDENGAVSRGISYARVNRDSRANDDFDGVIERKLERSAAGGHLIENWLADAADLSVDLKIALNFGGRASGRIAD